MPSLDSSIKAVFGGECAPEYTKDYLVEIRANWREAEKDLRRVIGTMILAVAVFQLTVASNLLDKAAGVTLPFLGIKIADIAIVQRILPIVVAYLFSNVAVLLSDIQLLSETHNRIYRLVDSKLYGNLMHMLLEPPNATFVSYGRRQHFVESPKAKLMFPMLFWSKFTVIVVGPVTYQIYAYWELFRQADGTNLLLIASCAITVMLMFSGLLILFGILRSTR